MPTNSSWSNSIDVPSEVFDQLRRVSSASITTILRKLGANVGHAYMTGIHPIVGGDLVVGRAVTLRYVPTREDVRPYLGPVNVAHLAIESIQPGNVLVVDALGSIAGGHFGDVMCTRIQLKGAGAVVMDGAIRDLPYLSKMGLPIFGRGATGPASPLTPIDYNVPINCGGALVLPGDLILADSDGVCVLPPGIAAEVARLTLEQEDLEVFIRQKLAEGRLLQDVYPPTEEVRREYEAQRGRA